MLSLKPSEDQVFRNPQKNQFLPVSMRNWLHLCPLVQMPLTNQSYCTP